MADWKEQWGQLVQRTKLPGVLRTKSGRFLVYGKVAGRLHQRVVDVADPHAAAAERLIMLTEAKQSTSAKSTPESKPLFAEYAQQLFERLLAQGNIRSKQTMERWKGDLKQHLIPAFGRFPVDAITKLDIEAWKLRIAKMFTDGYVPVRKGLPQKWRLLSPSTANGWLRLLLQILSTAVGDHQLPRDPTLRLQYFDERTLETYTEEDPNSLTVEQTREFLAAMRRLYPQFHAMTLLGFVTGLRPSTLRPLRRKGPIVDVLWQESAIRVRRSHTVGQESMKTTKTDNKYKLGLPPAVMRVLEEQDMDLTGKRATSDLLFPSKRGGYMSRSALCEPFAKVSAAIKLPFTLTPKGMRRTYQDLARRAGVDKEMRKAICGHESDEMTALYSTIRPDEMARAVGLIVATVLPPKKTKKAARRAA